MKFTELDLAGAFAIDVEPHTDDRGFFARSFCEREYVEHGLDATIVQQSISFNRSRGTVRGLHYQAAPHAETKTVRCTAGSVHDVIVDLRASSPTYGQWRAMELSALNRRTLYIPAGFAHGFQTLSDDAELLYQMSVEFAPTAARGIRWDDATLAIDWPMRGGVTISANDSSLPTFQDLRR